MRTLPPRATVPVLALVLANLAIHLVSTTWLSYGYMSDEFYYLDSTARLAWGYVDHPPLSLAVLKFVRAALGDSLPAVRLVPSLLSGSLVWIVAMLAREFGGGRTAQSLAALATATTPVFLGLTSFYSMNAIELVLWALASLCVARIVNTGDAKLWVVLGVVLGLGLLNKISMSWFGLGLGVGLVLTEQRRWLATPWPWVAAGIAFAMFAPHVFWQIEHDWPTLEFMRNAASEKMVSKSPMQFLGEQLLIVNPLFAPLWLAGLIHFFRREEGRRHQVQAWIWLSVCGLLIAGGVARANYLGPTYAALFAAGGVAFERFALLPRARWLPAVSSTVLAAGGLATAPLALPLLPPERFAVYSEALGITPPVEQAIEFGVMPLHFALRFGWPELIDAIEAAQGTLTPDERARAVVLGDWFGDTGAVNFLGPARGLPPAIAGHNNYWIWGPVEGRGDVVLAVAHDDSWLSLHFARVAIAAEIDCSWCLPYVDRLRVYVARDPEVPLTEIWSGLKRYE